MQNKLTDALWDIALTPWQRRGDTITGLEHLVDRVEDRQADRELTESQGDMLRRRLEELR